MNKLLLVDGHNLLFQMFFGMPNRILNEDGKDIRGTLGFVGALLKIIHMTRPTHVAVFFDGECKNERKELDAAYKANRPDYSQVPEEENPFSQLPDIYAALSYMGIAYAETCDCETDDWMAAYALQYSTEHEVVISSFDSDFFQLITDRVSILRYRGDNTVLCTPDYIRNKLGIEPCRYADYKSLTGDSADNIKGAKGIGPKTAAALINRFGTLENVLASAEAIEKPSIRASLLESGDRLRLNEKMIRLDAHAALPMPLEALLYHPNGLTTGQVLYGIGLRRF
ncbi:MAG: flap endonuclease [Clostridia bacterium]|nr:flap endonuclease [Clostridia bacterium]